MNRNSNTYQGPPIGSLSVTDALNDLGGEILRCATVRVGARTSLIRFEALLRQTEIGDLDVTFVVQKHIFRLQVPVDDAVLMQAAEGLHKLGRVEHGTSLRELLVLAQVVEQLATIEEVHHKVELGGRLERVVKLHDEGAVNFLKDISLSYSL